ncbi:unnamed protein product [Arctogadus glacialis]
MVVGEKEEAPQKKLSPPVTTHIRLPWCGGVGFNSDKHSFVPQRSPGVLPVCVPQVHGLPREGTRVHGAADSRILLTPVPRAP